MRGNSVQLGNATGGKGSGHQSERKKTRWQKKKKAEHSGHLGTSRENQEPPRRKKGPGNHRKGGK